jgi:hypothetical protein
MRRDDRSKRLLWFIGLWCAGVLAMGMFSVLFRALMSL